MKNTKIEFSPYADLGNEHAVLEILTLYDSLETYFQDMAEDFQDSFPEPEETFSRRQQAWKEYVEGILEDFLEEGRRMYHQLQEDDLLYYFHIFALYKSFYKTF